MIALAKWRYAIYNLLDTYEAPSETHRHCAPSIWLWPAAIPYAPRAAASLAIFIDFPLGFFLLAPSTSSCGKLWMKTAWNARKTFYNFHIYFFSSTSLSWKTWFECGLENFAITAASQPASLHRPLRLQTRLLDCSLRRAAQVAQTAQTAVVSGSPSREWEREREPERERTVALPFRHRSLVDFLVFGGEIKPTLYGQ